MKTTLLPRPERPYRALVADLEALGWVWAGELQRLPLIRGEPEQVDWVHPAGGRLRYTFNPAITLRTIEVDANPAQVEALERLPRLDLADVQRLLGAGDTEATLRGLFAARVIGDARLRTAVGPLRRHADPLVREAADAVWEALP